MNGCILLQDLECRFIQAGKECSAKLVEALKKPIIIRNAALQKGDVMLSSLCDAHQKSECEEAIF